MFTPFTLRGVTLPNRVVVSPMAQYSCVDGLPDDYYLVHLGSRAHGGAGLVFTEMACVAPDARISEGCAGLWNDAQRDAWRRIVDYVHARTPAKIALQLGHAGPKASTQLGWEDADEPIADPERNWPLVAPSAVPYGPRNQVPRAMTRADMDAVRDQFVAATRRGAEAGFDWLELHCAHGYLLSAFLCPLTNRRTDAYGGSLENRCRYPLEVFAAMRAAWPADKPMSVRISAHDWAPGGNTPDDAVAMAKLFRDAGADLIDVSSGQTTRAGRAGLRPHVPDPVRRPHPQRGRHRDDGRRRDLRARPRQQHPDGRARGPVRAGAARISPTRTGRCTPRRSSATTRCRGRRNTCRARRSSSAISRARPSRPRWFRRRTDDAECACGAACSRHRRRTRHRARDRPSPRVDGRVAFVDRPRPRAPLRRGPVAARRHRCATRTSATSRTPRRSRARSPRSPGPATACRSSSTTPASRRARVSPRPTMRCGPRPSAPNLSGTFHCTRAALPALLEARAGRVVNVASTAGLVGYPNVAAYVASKHGVVGLTRALALELASSGVTVNAVCPGYADTDIVREAVASIAARTGRSEADARTALASRNPQKRLIAPVEVASAVAWLCLPDRVRSMGR
jgi:anthraniloyl-CoA monooxygenase